MIKKNKDKLLKNRLKMGYTRFKVLEWNFPATIQCFKCQKIGHKALDCKESTQKCPICSENHNLAEHKNNPPKCVNCDGDYTSFSKSCEKLKESNKRKKVGQVSFTNSSNIFAKIEQLLKAVLNEHKNQKNKTSDKRDMLITMITDSLGKEICKNVNLDFAAGNDSRINTITDDSN
jgi:hypothetical protein